MDPDANNEEILSLKDQVFMLKDKIAYLQSRLEESENEAMIAAELGQRLLEEKGLLEIARDEERKSYTAKIEDLTQDNFNLNAKLDSKIRMLDIQTQEQDEQQKNKLNREIETIKLAYEKKVNDLKKEKLVSEDEIEQLNLKLQQKCEIIDNLHNTIEKQKAKTHAIQTSSSLEGELQELKVALQSCYVEKCEAEEKLEEFVHEGQRKNLEVETLRKRMNCLDEELGFSQKELGDCYKHFEEAKDTISELRTEITQLETELKSRGHSKKGNSLFGELEDKRIVAERDLAIFKVRYNSLQKAYASAKNEILKMKYQVLAFLQTRSDRADRMRIEHLEQSLTSAKHELNMLAHKLRRKEEEEISNDPLKKVQMHMQDYSGPESTKHYVKLLLVNAEEYKNKIESLKKELHVVRLSYIGKSDELQDIQRKLYTATNTSDRNRNEALRAKLKLDEMVNKLESEKQKRAELEAFIKNSSADKNVDCHKETTKKPDERGVSIESEERIIKENEKQRLEDDAKMSIEVKDKCLKEKNDNVFTGNGRQSAVVNKSVSLTAEERREKCIKALKNALPEELAAEYLKSYDDSKDAKENNNKYQRLPRNGKQRAKERKVSFKDEVDHFDDDVVYEADDVNKISNTKMNDQEKDSKVVVVNANEEKCHVQ